jgi:TolB-like protein
MVNTALTILVSGLVFASPNTDSEPKQVASKPLESRQAEVKQRLAIMALSADGVPAAYAVGLTETIATALSQTGVFETVSPKQISSLLAYEKRRDALGDCDDAECYTQIAKLVRADFLISGSVAQVGDTIVMNLALVDSKAGKVSKRLDKKISDATELMLNAHKVAIALVQPILSEKQGYLRIAANVSRAEIYIDDELRIENLGQIIALSAGPHTLRLVRDGFYRVSGQFLIKPDLVHEERATLIPAKATLQAYETKAKAMRYGAYVATLIAIGAGVGGVYYYGAATDDKLVVDSFASALESERAFGDRRAGALAAQDRFDTNQALYLVGLSSAVISAASAGLLYLFGDDPDRYEAFTDLMQ